MPPPLVDPPELKQHATRGNPPADFPAALFASGASRAVASITEDSAGYGDQLAASVVGLNVALGAFIWKVFAQRVEE